MGWTKEKRGNRWQTLDCLKCQNPENIGGLLAQLTCLSPEKEALLANLFILNLISSGNPGERVCVSGTWCGPVSCG